MLKTFHSVHIFPGQLDHKLYSRRRLRCGEFVHVRALRAIYLTVQYCLCIPCLSTSMASCSSPFLNLPFELRVCIYRLTLPHSEYHNEKAHLDHPILWRPGTCAGILFTNKQIHSETSTILYRENFFAIYVRHPRNARLEYNESRADPEAFALISWEHRFWAHPRQTRIRLSTLQKHRNLHDIRKWYISVPDLSDLLGVDTYMRTTSTAAFHGVDFWITKCADNQGHLEGTDSERMAYVQMYKEPIDEVGRFLRSLPQLDHLSLGLGHGKFDIRCREYVLDEILQSRSVKDVKCFYVPTRRERWAMNIKPLERYEQIIRAQHGSFAKEKPQLPGEIERMYWLLQAIYTREIVDPPTNAMGLIN